MKIGIGAKIAILLLALVCLTAGSLVWRFWDVSKRIVIEHEEGDLIDETKLRARELQSQLFASRRDVTELARFKNLNVEGYLEGGPAADIVSETTLKRLGEKRLDSYLRFELWERTSDGTLTRVGAHENRQRANPLENDVEVVGHLIDAVQQASLDVAVSDIRPVDVERRRPDGTTLDRVHVFWTCAPVLNDDEVWIGPAGQRLFAVIAMDMDAPLPNGESSPLVRLNNSPRHLAYIANEQDATGKSQAVPKPEVIAIDESKGSLLDSDDLELLQKQFAALYQERTKLTADDVFVQVFLPKQDIPAERGVTLHPALWFRQTDDIDEKLRKKLLESLKGKDGRSGAYREIVEEIPSARINQLSGNIKNLRVLANSSEEIDRITAKIDAHIAADPELAGLNLHWRRPVKCEHCIIHAILFPMRLSKDRQRYFGLAQAAFREEMTADVDAELASLIGPALLIVGVVALAGFIASLAFTRPLNQLTRAAELVAQENPSSPATTEHRREQVNAIASSLPVSRHDEIGVLARAFKQMLGHVAASQESLQQLNSELEQRIKQRTQDLEAANEELLTARDKAHELSKAKDAFLANVSHDLRNPLNQVSGFCQLLEMTDLDEEQLSDLRKIKDAGAHLLLLVNDILDYQKIVMGGITLEPESFSVAQLLGEVRDAIEFPARENSNQLEVVWSKDVGEMFADKQRLRQVLVNLAGNACKFTQQGLVRVSARRETFAGDADIVFDISDTGRGMTPEEQSKLFTPFTKLAAKKGNRTGTGLGLVISKGFTELMQGKISLKSEFGKGTTFTVRLPASTAPTGDGRVGSQDSSMQFRRRSSTVAARTNVVPAAESPVGHRGSVLVIDDDENVRELMTRYLSAQGFRILAAATGVEGIELAKRLQPTVITLDAIMPGLDGWSVLAALKANPETAEIPVIMVTMVDNPSRGQVMGASEFIVKPIDWTRLVQLLDRYTSAGTERTVLVVDDDSAARELMRRKLESDGWHVDEAENGREALDRLRSAKPAVVLLDLLMPVMDGFEFLNECSKSPGENVPVIVITAKDPTREELECLQGLGIRVLQKGHFEQDELLREIHRRVDHHVQQSMATNREAEHAENSHR